jgi:cell wall-associated NlpC family hydrolase
MAGFGTFFQDLHEGVKRGLAASLRGASEGPLSPAQDYDPFAATEAGGLAGLNTFSSYAGAGYNPFGAGGMGGAFDPFQATAGTNYDPFAWTARGDRTLGSPKSDAKSGTAIEAGDWSGPATADDNRTLDGAKIDAWIAQTRPGSPLAGKGGYILQVANQYGVSAPLLLGIFLKESELGTTAGPGYNLAGVGGEGNFAQYGSWEQAIDGAARNLGGPTYKGKSAAEQIGYWFVGPQGFAAGGLGATDSTGGRNGTVGDYLNGPVASAYRGLGVPFNPSGAGTRRAGGAVPPSQIAARTQQLAGTVGYTSGGVRVTGNIADGADCSSWAGWLIGADAGDWNAQRLYDVSDRVGAGDLQPGDLVFFDIANPGDATARPVGHVAVYLGGGMISQSTTLGGTNGVQITNLAADPYLSAHVYGYGRYRRRGGTTEGNQ